MTFDQWWEEYLKMPDNAPLSDYEMDVARDAWNASQINAAPRVGDLDTSGPGTGEAVQTRSPTCAEESPLPLRLKRIHD